MTTENNKKTVVNYWANGRPPPLPPFESAAGWKWRGREKGDRVWKQVDMFQTRWARRTSRWCAPLWKFCSIWFCRAKWSEKLSCHTTDKSCPCSTYSKAKTVSCICSAGSSITLGEEGQRTFPAKTFPERCYGSDVWYPKCDTVTKSRHLLCTLMTL